MYILRYSTPGTKETKEIEVDDDFALTRDDCEFATPPEGDEWDELNEMENHHLIYDKRGVCIITGRRNPGS